LKVSVKKISHLNIHENAISLKAYLANNTAIKSDLKNAPSIVLCVSGKNIPCKFISMTEKKDFSVLLGLPKSLDAALVLFYHIGKEVEDCFLLTEEIVDPEIYKETYYLLEDFAAKSGRRQQDILFEITEFKKGVGRRDLKHVSEKQMVIVRDRLKDILKSSLPVVQKVDK